MTTPRTPPVQKKKDEAKVDLSKQRGLYDTPDLREKVLKWQIPPKTCPAVEVKSKVTEKQANDIQKSTAEKVNDLSRSEETKKAVVEKGEELKCSAVAQDVLEDDTTLEQDLRAASAPKKRVVSDEHWRKSQPPSANKAVPSPKPTPPALAIANDLYMRPGSNKYEGWVRRKSTPTRLNTPEKLVKASPNTTHRKASQPKVTASAKKENLQVPEDAVKLILVEPSTPAKRKMTPTMSTTEQNKAVNSTEAVAVTEKYLKSASPQSRKASQEKKKSKSPVPAPAPKPVKPALDMKPNTDRVRAVTADAKVTKSSPTRDDDEAFAYVAGTRVDAWLTNTPDPFIDDGVSDWSDEEQSSPIEVANTAQFVKPLSIRVRKIETRRSEPHQEQRRGIPSRRETKFGTRTRSVNLSPEARPLRQKPHTETHYFSPRHSPDDDNHFSDGSSSEILTPTTPTLKRSKATRKTMSPKSNARARSKPVPATVPATSAPRGSTFLTDHADEAQAHKTNDENASPWYKDKAQNRGNHLSTTASVETLNTTYEHTSGIPHSKSAVELRHTRTSPPRSTMAEHSDVETRSRPRLARKMTSHADLISVLSMADDDGKGIFPSNSVRSTRSKPAAVTLSDLMLELKNDEVKYLRELRTMVDGVVPVLLNCVVSKSSSAVAAGLFNNLQSGSEATAPIMNMGVALERLKSAHQRMPNSNADALLMWAQGSHRIYADYLQAWRMGFQDVVVNLAPADKTAGGPTPDSSRSTLARDADGYVVNNNGGKVDVAYLLKRPLVRLKYLARTLKDIESLAPSDQASLWAVKYQDLVRDARRRQDEERARLEDLAASSIDPTRAREPQTLAPLAGVRINPSRYVRARDFFTLKLQHSSGQRIDCGVELLLRENAPELGEGGDVLICEVDSASKWLLFPPIQISQISARAGDHEDELVGMVRGQNASDLEWYELLSLKAGNPLICHEWTQLLGTKPCPPSITNHKVVDKGSKQVDAPGTLVLAVPDKSRTHSQMVVDVPIGEKADGRAKQWRSQSTMIPEPVETVIRPRTTSYYEDDYIPQNRGSMPGSPTASQVSHSWRQNFTPSPGPEIRGSSPLPPAKHILHPSRSPLPSPPPPPVHQRSPSNNSPHHGSSVPRSSSERRGTSPTRSTISRASSYTVWYPQDEGLAEDSEDEYHRQTQRGANFQRPGMERKISNTPTENLPHIPRVRIASPNRGYATGDGCSFGQSPGIRRKDLPVTSPLSRPHGNGYGSPVHSSPRTPLHSPSQPKSGATKHNTPGSSTQRRSSSPLKREYRPSSDSDSSSAMGDIQSDDDESITSDSSADDLFSYASMPAGLFKPRLPSGSVYSPKSPDTLTPSQSASQAPYRTVPPQDKPALKMIAMLFCWSEKGSWESIHPDECSIVVSPGLIEAFEMSAAHSAPNLTSPASPLVALELTPLVPLRRGTALDISIRSPPTANSHFRAGNNIMFRSRTGQECELLYGYINQARINNPTYIALQNARGSFGGSTWANYMDHRANNRNNSAWWRFGSKKSSYRKSTTRPGNSSSVAQTESSVGTVSGGGNTSGMSATLRRISGGSKVFNVAKSTVTPRGHVSGSSTTFTSSSGTSTSTPPPLSMPAGLTNALHIRLYLRETASKWRDMGSARLTIMHPPASGPTLSTPQKRILITGKTRGETLLDVVLGESCFERVARTGIAVNIWEERRGPNGEVGVVAHTGGVGGGKGRVWMVQCKSEAETAYAFSLLGRLRY